MDKPVATQFTSRDPRYAYPAPPFPSQQQEGIVTIEKMVPRPDHGEASYVDFGRMAGRRAIITGGDSGIGRAVAIAFAREGASVLSSGLHDGSDDAHRHHQRHISPGLRSVRTSARLCFDRICSARLHPRPGKASRPRGIRVNAVAPGPFWTPRQPSDGQTDEKVQHFEATSLFGRPGQPAEIAAAFVFLATQESGFMTGETIGFTGGHPIA